MGKRSTGNGNAAERRKRRIGIFALQAGICHWCKELMSIDPPGPTGAPPPNYATFEHVTPMAAGGSFRRENIVLACYSCNNGRGDNAAPPQS